MEDHPSRVESDNPKLYRWTSWESNTPFAPYFDIPVYIDDLGETITNDLVDLISAKKCSRENWLEYNLFSWSDLVVQILSDRIYQIYLDYINELGEEVIPKDKLWIRGWGVTLQPNEGIPHHSHAFHENSYLSGNISLSELGTSTDYLFPYLGWYFGYWKVKNVMGQMTLFPSWLEHAVGCNPTNEVRFSIAFDMFTEHTINYIRENRNNTSENQKTILLSKRMDVL